MEERQSLEFGFLFTSQRRRQNLLPIRNSHDFFFQSKFVVILYEYNPTTTERRNQRKSRARATVPLHLLFLRTTGPNTYVRDGKLKKESGQATTVNSILSLLWVMSTQRKAEKTCPEWSVGNRRENSKKISKLCLFFLNSSFLRGSLRFFLLILSVGSSLCLLTSLS